MKSRKEVSSALYPAEAFDAELDGGVHLSIKLEPLIFPELSSHSLPFALSAEIFSALPHQMKGHLQSRL